MRKLQGIILSDKMKKTRVVGITRLKQHSLYGKSYKVTAKFKVHDEREEYKAGDKVVIRETRPLSKDKRWEIVALIERKESDNKE